MMRHKKHNKEQTNKDRNHRILNIYSSHQSSTDLNLKATSLPLKKNTKPQQSHHKHRQPPKKDKAKGQSSQARIKAPQVYERIPVAFVNSNSNSEIDFSSYGETAQEGIRPLKKHLFINVGSESLLMEILNADKRKIQKQEESAIKIQKVFRGFMTRKLLQKYIEEYEQKLIAERNQIKRKNTFVTNSQEDSFYIGDLKNSFFLSNKKLRSQNRREYQSKQLQFQSSILEQNDIFLSIQDPGIEQKYTEEQKIQCYDDRSNNALSESSIAPQGQQISLSFGQDVHHSPHFHQKVPCKYQEYPNIESPNKYQKETIGLSEDKTRDVYSHNISISPNYYRHNRSSQTQQQANLTSIKSEGMEPVEASMQKLKSSQKAKWEQVIQFVNENLQGPINNQMTKDLFSAILNFSVKNREELNKSQEQFTPSTITCRVDETLHNFKKKEVQQESYKMKEQPQIEKREKAQNMPLVRRVKHSRMNIFERTLLMKEYLVRSMHLQDQQIDKMMQLRQSMLRRKQSDSLLQLNFLLQNNRLSQEQFLDKLHSLTASFQQQKQDIQRNKKDIYNGYKAQLELLKNTALDAKLMGYNIPFCRSMQIFPNRSRWHFDSVMIDQLDRISNKRRLIKEEEKIREHNSPIDFGTIQIDNLLKESSESSFELPQRQVLDKSDSQQEDVSFNYEQTTLYEQQEVNKVDVTPQLRQVTSLGRGLAVPVFEEDNNLEPMLQSNRMSKSNVRRELFKLESESQSEEDYEAKKNQEEKVLSITESVLNILLWELLDQTTKCPKMLRNFGMRGSYLYPEPIKKEERLTFMEGCLDNLPSFESVYLRLNQKMYPNLKQMLYSMRQCDEDEENEQEYIEIGQYQYLLNQDICFDRIQNYLDVYRQARKKQMLLHSYQENIDPQFRKEYSQYASEEIKIYVMDRQIIRKQQLKHMEEEREQTLRIQLHMLFDVWNEYIIKYRENKYGYSGIGLNQLSLSLIDRISPPMTVPQQYHLMMKQTQENIKRVIMNDNFHERISQEFEGHVCRNDSQWILYSQEALQYAFDIVKMVELELIFECLHEIHLMREQSMPINSSASEGMQESIREFQSSLSSGVQLSSGRLYRGRLDSSEVESEEDDSFYK